MAQKSLQLMVVRHLRFKEIDFLDIIFATGGRNTTYEGWINKAETYNVSSLKWEQRPNYPFAKYIAEYAILPVENEFIIFGGIDYYKCISNPCPNLPTIAGFNPFTNTWRHLGKLIKITSTWP